MEDKYKYESVKCLKCGHKQNLVDGKNIWQDIMGQFTVCEKCDNGFIVEPRELNK